MADKLWARYGYFDITELTIPQIKLYSDIASNSSNRIDLEKQREFVALMRTGFHGDEKALRDFHKLIKSALIENKHDRQVRVGYERKGKILKPA